MGTGKDLRKRLEEAVFGGIMEPTLSASRIEIVYL